MKNSSSTRSTAPTVTAVKERRTNDEQFLFTRRKTIANLPNSCYGALGTNLSIGEKEQLMHSDECLTQYLWRSLTACGKPAKQRVYVDPGDVLTVGSSKRRQRSKGAGTVLRFKRAPTVSTESVELILPDNTRFEIKFLNAALRHFLSLPKTAIHIGARWRNGQLKHEAAAIPLHLLRGCEIHTVSVPSATPGSNPTLFKRFQS